MPETPDPGSWDRYLAEYHDANPGITEDVLGDARDAMGRSPYQWLVEAVPQTAAIVVDLACGSCPLARLLGARRVVGIDRSAGELTRARASTPSGLLLRARATALPICNATADAVVVSMALMLLWPLEAVLAEVGRLLRPGGRLVATVPIRPTAPGAARASAFSGILDALGQTGRHYPALDGGRDLANRFSGSGLVLAQDDVALFSRAVHDPDDAELVVRSFYAPGADGAEVDAAVAGFQRRIESTPGRVEYRVRRLVAER